MSILTIMIPIALLLSFGFLASFLWATQSGQFDDVETPAQRILIEPEERNHT